MVRCMLSEEGAGVVADDRGCNRRETGETLLVGVTDRPAVRCVSRACWHDRAARAGGVLALSTLACGGGGDRNESDTTANAVVPGAELFRRPGPGIRCPQGAKWNLGDGRGATARGRVHDQPRPPPVNGQFMSVPVPRSTSGGGHGAGLPLWRRRGARARHRQAGSARAAPTNGAAPWRTPATLITDNNMAAIALTGDRSARARITEALHRRSEGDGALRDSVQPSRP